jgi:hypothetical protein
MKTESHFGCCPYCGADEEYLNVGRDHWFFCREHKVRWCPGSNLLSTWRGQNPEEWKENEKTLLEFEVIEPVYEFERKSDICEGCESFPCMCHVPLDDN